MEGWVWLLPMLFLFLFGPRRFKPFLSLSFLFTKREFKNKGVSLYRGSAVSRIKSRDVRSLKRIYTEYFLTASCDKGRWGTVEVWLKISTNFRTTTIDDMERDTWKNRANRTVKGETRFLPACREIRWCSSVATWLALRGHSSRVHLFRG